MQNRKWLLLDNKPLLIEDGTIKKANMEQEKSLIKNNPF